MQSKMEALNTVQHKAAEAMYQSASAAGGGGPSGEPGGDPRQARGRRRRTGDVIDAEVVEEEKK